MQKISWLAILLIGGCTLILEQSILSNNCLFLSFFVCNNKNAFIFS